MRLSIKNGIKPAGSVPLPPSKSEAIRAILLLALSGGDVRHALRGYEAMPVCDDIRHAMDAAEKLDGLPYIGESAALMRFMIPIMLALFERAELRVERRLFDRGIDELCACLDAEPIFKNGVLSISRRLDRRVYRIDCSRSSQFLSGLMIALPLLNHECEIRIINSPVSMPYVRMTEQFVSDFGGIIERTDFGYRTYPSAYREPKRIPVTGDRSYAAVFEAMNMLGGNIVISGSSDTLQPDAAFTELALKSSCCVGDCPDLLPLIAAHACGREGVTRISGTGRLSSKESDRPRGIVDIINDLGGKAELGSDSVTVYGRDGLDGGSCDVLNDHRLAFAACVLSIISSSPVIIEGAECVNKSAPGFWNEKIGMEYRVIQ
ncbi:MAG: hypothetical protein II747_04965 [Clostridia bacterium]|nr:hypothetical protein [Clostridia bacterium]